jgi:hypothetical protein
MGVMGSVSLAEDHFSPSEAPPFGRARQGGELITGIGFEYGMPADGFDFLVEVFVILHGLGGQGAGRNKNNDLFQ